MRKCFKNERCSNGLNMMKKCRGESGLFLKIYLHLINSSILAVVIGILVFWLINKEIHPVSQPERYNALDLFKRIEQILVTTFQGSSLLWLQYTVVTVASSVVLVSFLGCCGACTESICFIGFHGILSLTFVFFEITFAILFLAYKNEVWTSTTHSLEHSIKYVYNSTYSHSNSTHPSILSVTKSWDHIQANYNCCGVYSPDDYKHSMWFNSSTASDGVFVPISCCVEPQKYANRVLSGVKLSNKTLQDDNMCQIDAILFPRLKAHRISFLKRKGCGDVLGEVIEKCQPIVISSVSLILFIHIVNTVVSFMLIRWLKKKFGDVSSYCDDDFNEDT